jgi:hypothetical protein
MITRYMLEFDYHTTGFICPYCQGLCSCASCRPETGRESPLPIDPYAPSLTASQQKRDAYNPPTHAKKAWKLNQKAWRVMHGLTKRRRARPRKSGSVKIEEVEVVKALKPPPGKTWFIGKNQWKDGSDPQWDKLRSKLSKGRES